MSYRKRVIHEETEGLYMTAAQLGFYCNDSSGLKSFKNEDDDFYNYYCRCMTHNVFYDSSEIEPEDCHIVWDHHINAISYRASGKAKIWTTLKKLGIEL
jgi:hypothetical protein